MPRSLHPTGDRVDAVDVCGQRWFLTAARQKTLHDHAAWRNWSLDWHALRVTADA
jgi:hypothetical protein